jgi:hypothetical protein
MPWGYPVRSGKQILQEYSHIVHKSLHLAAILMKFVIIAQLGSGFFRQLK